MYYIDVCACPESITSIYKDCPLDKWTEDMTNRPFKKNILKQPNALIIKEMQVKTKIIPLRARENADTKHTRVPVTSVGKDLEQLKTPCMATRNMN